MAVSFQQTDGAAGAGSIAACSALTVGVTPINRQATIGGTPGATVVSPGEAATVTNQAILFFELPVSGYSWDAGTWTVRLNVSTANSTVTWASVYICRLNSSNVSQATIGSNLSVSVSCSTTGVKTATVTGSSQAPASGDKVYIVCGFTNSASMSTQTIGITPNQLIDSPFSVPSPSSEPVIVNQAAMRASVR